MRYLPHPITQNDFVLFLKDLKPPLGIGQVSDEVASEFVAALEIPGSFCKDLCYLVSFDRESHTCFAVPC